MDTLRRWITAQTEEELHVNLYILHNVNLIKLKPRLSGGSGLVGVKVASQSSIFSDRLSLRCFHFLLAMLIR